MKAIVIGSNGQDGTFLVRHLLQRHYEVAGVGRQPQSRWDISSSKFSYYQVDLEVQGVLSTVLSEYRPDVIFHVAAVHTSAGGQYEPHFRAMMTVNVASVHDVLEYMRLHPQVRLCYASSAKVFGSVLPPHIDENTSVKSECLYSISKNSAFNVIDYYRKTHHAQASVLYFFNHESELRAESFFIPKMLNILNQSRKDSHFVAKVNTLDFYCDWGSAEEYMDIMIDVIEKTPGEDYVLGRGECTYAQKLVEELFALHGLDYTKHLQQSMSNKIPARPYIVDMRKLKRMIGRVPEVTIKSLCIWTLDRIACKKPHAILSK
ncbi:MAG: GDP-mannose 4,6-dehydratase [Legionellaceae bacterium]|nr:GDP-mannose 4,6-dehydratase [Legionellaceae bacterium]